MEQLLGHRTDWTVDKVKLTTCCHVCPVLIPDTGYRLVLVDGFTFVNIYIVLRQLDKFYR